MKKTFLFILGFLVLVSMGWSDVFMTELADPNNNAGVRYIELYNSGGSPVDFTEGSNWRIDKYTNASATVSQTLNLTGTIAAGGFYIIATGTDDGDFLSVYGVSANQFDGASDNVAGSNGDDNLELYNGAGTLVDQFGVPGEDGTGTNHEFEDGRAERKATVTTGNATWDVNEWNIDSDQPSGDGAQDAPDGFDPTEWIGAAASPTITLSTTSLTNFTYVLGNGPSPEQSFTAEGSDLSANITITPPTNYEISTGTAGSFVATNPITLTHTGGTVASTTIYVRLKTGLSIANYNNETISATSSDATTKIIACYGAVTGTSPVEPTAGELIITEVVGDAADATNDDGFMEIYNNSSSTINLNNVQARYYNSNPGDPSFTQNLSGYIEAGDYIVVTQNNTNFTTEYSFAADFANGSFYFNGDDDGVDVYHTSNGVLDQFNDNGALVTAWSWSDANVFERTSTASGTIITNWTEITTGNGTPGAANDNPLPVTLTDFSTAIIMNEFVQISWTTQTESSINTWNLFRSIENSPDQILLHSEPGTNTTQPYTYIFEDHEVNENVIYYYYLEATEYDGTSNMWGPISAMLEGSSTPELPTTSLLESNYPNPFNPSTAIMCVIKEGEEGKLTIYNSRGQVIESQILNAGEHIVEWDGSQYGSGVYLYKLETMSYTETRKMIMIK